MLLLISSVLILTPPKYLFFQVQMALLPLYISEVSDLGSKFDILLKALKFRSELLQIYIYPVGPSFKFSCRFYLNLNFLQSITFKPKFKLGLQTANPDVP